MKRMPNNFPQSWRWLATLLLVTAGPALPLASDSQLGTASAQTSVAGLAPQSSNGSPNGAEATQERPYRLPPVARVSRQSGHLETAPASARLPVAATLPAAAQRGDVSSLRASGRVSNETAPAGYLPAALRGSARQVSHDETWLDAENLEAIPLAPTLLRGERPRPTEVVAIPVQDGIDVGPIPAGWTLKSVDTLKLGIFPDRTHPLDAAEGILAGAPKGPLFEQVQIGRVATWIAPNITYQPLLFEDARLERYGFASPYFAIQPIRSGFHFTNSALLFPIRAVVYRNECESPLAFERPGNQVAPSREVFVPAIGW